jgi:hypothetical protein
VTTPEALATHYIALPADAADAPLFALRIRENLSDSNDFVWIDDIRIVGTPIVVIPHIDTTPPVVTWISPLSGSILSGTVNLITNISDNSGSFTIHYMIDGNDISPDGTTSPYSHPLNTTTLSGGSRTIVAHATDSSGNETMRSITATIANQA